MKDSHGITIFGFIIIMLCTSPWWLAYMGWTEETLAIIEYVGVRL